MAGSFLAVNNGKGRFDRYDMLVHLDGFSPSPATPITLV
jgi:hypothetical protein